MENNTSSLTHSNDAAALNSVRVPGIGRRSFVRACAVTGAGLAVGAHRGLLKAAACPARGKAATSDIRVGLDIGGSKVCAAVGELLPDGAIKILGIGQAASHGVTAHGIVDCEAASACVRAALVNAEVQSDVMIGSVVLAVPGTRIAPFGTGLAWERIFKCEGGCYAERGDGILEHVSLADCQRTPELRVVYGAHQRIQNSIRCLEGLGVEVERVVFAPVASAAAVLSPLDRERSVLVMDLGAGTTDYAVYSGGALVQSDCLPAGGGRIANELSLGLQIPLAHAEKLLIKEGSVWLGLSLPDERQQIVIPREPGFSGAEIEREALNTIIHQSVRCIFERLKCQLVNSGVRLNSLRGVRLSGGCYRLPGIEHLALEIFDLFPASRFRMRSIEADVSVLNNPRLACAVGLIKLCAPLGA